MPVDGRRKLMLISFLHEEENTFVCIQWIVHGTVRHVQSKATAGGAAPRSDLLRYLPLPLQVPALTLVAHAPGC